MAKTEFDPTTTKKDDTLTTDPTTTKDSTKEKEEELFDGDEVQFVDSTGALHSGRIHAIKRENDNDPNVTPGKATFINVGCMNSRFEVEFFNVLPSNVVKVERLEKLDKKLTKAKEEKEAKDKELAKAKEETLAKK